MLRNVLYAQPDAGVFGDHRHRQHRADAAVSGLILTLVGMYGLMFLTYKTADKPVGILSAFAFTGFWVISGANPERVPVCRDG